MTMQLLRIKNTSIKLFQGKSLIGHHRSRCHKSHVTRSHIHPNKKNKQARKKRRKGKERKRKKKKTKNKAMIDRGVRESVAST